MISTKSEQNVRSFSDGSLRAEMTWKRASSSVWKTSLVLLGCRGRAYDSHHDSRHVGEQCGGFSGRIV